MKITFNIPIKKMWLDSESFDGYECIEYEYEVSNEEVVDVLAEEYGIKDKKQLLNLFEDYDLFIQDYEELLKERLYTKVYKKAKEFKYD